jgi:hypothetical protein
MIAADSTIDSDDVDARLSRGQFITNRMSRAVKTRTMARGRCRRRETRRVKQSLRGSPERGKGGRLEEPPSDSESELEGRSP